MRFLSEQHRTREQPDSQALNSTPIRQCSWDEKYLQGCSRESCLLRGQKLVTEGGSFGGGVD